MSIPLGTTLTAFGKSKHSGQSGTVVADYGDFVMVTADDQKYSGASKNSAWDLKVFQLDTRFVTTAKTTKKDS